MHADRWCGVVRCGVPAPSDLRPARPPKSTNKTFFPNSFATAFTVIVLPVPASTDPIRIGVKGDHSRVALENILTNLISRREALRDRCHRLLSWLGQSQAIRQPPMSAYCYPQQRTRLCSGLRPLRCRYRLPCRQCPRPRDADF
jgi:hypothetical protein